MDNIVKVKKCLPELCAEVAPFGDGALQGLIDIARDEIDNYDLEGDVVDFLETSNVNVDQHGRLVLEQDARVMVWDRGREEWVEEDV